MKGKSAEKSLGRKTTDENPEKTASFQGSNLGRVILMFSTANFLNGLLNGFISDFVDGHAVTESLGNCTLLLCADVCGILSSGSRVRGF